MMADTYGNDQDENTLGEVANHDLNGTPTEIDEQELELADEEERLPWLESGEYEEDEIGSDNSRLIGFVLLGLLALALLIGLIWWLSNRSPDPELVADGSTIEAPDGDYKERPEDPGGRSFDETGSVASAVGEGETREGRVADGTNARGGNDNSANSGARSDSGDAAASGSASGTAPATGGVGVQVGAFSTRERAVTGWSNLRGQTQALNGFKYRIVEGQADIGRVFRLQAVAGNASAANSLCSKLKNDGVPCQVKR